MAISFPASPLLNQTYTLGTKTWIWNGYAWDIVTPDISPIYTQANSGVSIAQSAFNQANNSNTFNQAYTDSLVSSNNVTLKAYTDSVVGSNNVTLKAYTDSLVSSNNVTLKAYTDSVVSSNNTSLRANDGITLASAKSYTDSLVSSNNVTLKAYTDSVVSSNNTTLKAYTDSVVSSNNVTLKAYTDSVVSSNNTTLKAYTDSVVSSNNTSITTAYKSYADSVVSSNNTTLKAYTDSIVSSNNVTLKAYTDSVVSSNNTSLRANDGITLASAKSYTDAKNTFSTLVNISNDLIVTGNLTIQGTTTTLNSTTLRVNDKNLELANVATPTNTTADGGGITVIGATNKTFNWVNSTGAWTSSENLDLASGKSFSINGVTVLTGSTLSSNVTTSSLTAVGTITSGVWNAGSVTASQLTSTVATGTAPFVVTSTTAVANLSIGGNAATATNATNATNAAFLRQTDGTGILTPVQAITTTGSRTIVLAPNTYAYGLFSEFKGSSAFSSTGTYSGLITYAPWVGTTASTGDPSYQLLFSPAAANSTAAPVLKIRAGIDTTWGSWSTILHSSNYNSYSPTLTGTGASGTWGININGTVGATTANTGAFTNLSYTGTLTGNTGIIAIGTNQIYKDASGNVGIGTSSPSSKLDVSTSINLGASYLNVSYDMGGGLGWLGGYNVTFSAGVKNVATGTLSAASYQSGGVVFYTNTSSAVGTIASERMRIDSSGNVGIGTSSPSGKLGIVTTASTAAWQIVANTTGVINHTGIFADASNNMQFAARDGSGVLRVVIDSNSSTNSYINSGNVGIGTASPSYKLQVAGSFAATTKSFVIDHPTKEGMKLRYGSLEGPENGIYIRGRLNGNNIIELPEYWTKLIDEDSITVNLTPIGKHQKLYVADIVDNTVIIGNDNLLQKEINCFYTVFAERIDVEKLIVEIE